MSRDADPAPQALGGQPRLSEDTQSHTPAALGSQSNPAGLRSHAALAQHTVRDSKAFARPMEAREGPWRLAPWQLDALLASLAIKIALFPSYHSTDFEVHRHWLALTTSLPLSQWYFDVTSQWTLDYPPFFGYFSWLLALPARWINPKIVHLTEGLGYESWSCKLYMRATVILTELLLVSALWALARPPALRRAAGELKSDAKEEGAIHDGPASSAARLTEAAQVTTTAILLHPGLIIVDHVHFQYNGFLFGFLLWSFWAAREDRPLLCAALYSSLLVLKHIFVYFAPAYFVFLLRTYVLRPASAAAQQPVDWAGAMERLFTLASVTLLPPAIAFGPFLLDGLSPSAPEGPLGEIAQILRRLFPFARGLNHAYWAPNAWAIYTAADRALIKLARRFPGLVAAARLRGLESTAEAAFASTSRGIVGDVSFGVLPAVTARTCLLLTLLPIVLYSSKLWTTTRTSSAAPGQSAYVAFLHTLGLCGLTSFLFGYHVHEKAILLPLLPLTLLAPYSWDHVRVAMLLSSAGIVGLMPLLFRVQDTVTKLAFSLAWGLATYVSLARIPAIHRPAPTHALQMLLQKAENAYLLGFLPMLLYTECLHPLLFPTIPAAALTGRAPTFGEVRPDPAATFASADAGMSNPAPMSRMEFLPLLITSVYCAVGVAWVWLRLSWLFITYPGGAIRALPGHLK